MIPLNHSLLAYFLFLVAYMYHACPQRPTFAPPTSDFRKINVTFLHQEIKSLPFLPFTHTTLLQKSYSDPESEMESEPEAQPIDFIHECFEEIWRHYGPRPWAPTEQKANEPTTPNTQRDTTTHAPQGKRSVIAAIGTTNHKELNQPSKHISTNHPKKTYAAGEALCLTNSNGRTTTCLNCWPDERHRNGRNGRRQVVYSRTIPPTTTISGYALRNAASLQVRRKRRQEENALNNDTCCVTSLFCILFLSPLTLKKKQKKKTNKQLS